MRRINTYQQVIEGIFKKYYVEGLREIDFLREELVEMALILGVPVAKNLGDVLYSFRYRKSFPESIAETAPEGYQWILRTVGRGKYQFALTKAIVNIRPTELLSETKVLDSTPGIIKRYALNDEQALLAILRYNRLIDIFTGLTCYSLQNHLRTAVPAIGQIETDELYIGVDKRGAHFVIPVQAKGGKDQLSVVQIEQDYALCDSKFKNLICKPIAAQFMAGGVIAIFEFENSIEGIKIAAEKHYKLVESTDLTDLEIEFYNNRT